MCFICAVMDYKRSTDFHRTLCFSALCILPPLLHQVPVVTVTWLTYTLYLMHSSSVFHCNGELWYAGCGNPLCALVSFTRAIKSKAVTHKAKYAWCFQCHLSNGWNKCSGFHRKEQKLLCHILENTVNQLFAIGGIVGVIGHVGAINVLKQ